MQFFTCSVSPAENKKSPVAYRAVHASSIAHRETLKQNTRLRKSPEILAGAMGKYPHTHAYITQWRQ